MEITVKHISKKRLPTQQQQQQQFGGRELLIYFIFGARDEPRTSDHSKQLYSSPA
jgi:hypothetical protein